MTNKEQFASLMKQDVATLQALVRDLDLPLPADNGVPTTDKNKLVALLMGECVGCPDQAVPKVTYLFKGVKSVFNSFSFTPKSTGGPCLNCPK